MEVAMTQYTENADCSLNTLYVLLGSLLATVVCLPMVWYLAEAAYTVPGLGG
jgi:hypothetical protein